jgi:hypothetical protein
MTHLDANFKSYCGKNFGMILIILAKIGVKRLVIDAFPNYTDIGPQLNVGQAIALAFEVNEGDPQDLEKFCEMLAVRSLPKELIARIWAEIERLDVPIVTLDKVVPVNGRRLSMRVQYSLKRAKSPEEAIGSVWFAVCSSWKVIGMLLDWLIANWPEFLTEHIAEIILAQSSMLTKGHATIKSRSAGQATDEYDIRKGAFIGLVGPKKLIAAPLIRYVRAVVPVVGDEKVKTWLAGILRDIAISLAFVNDVLSDPKENALGEKELGHFIEEFIVVAELGLEFDRKLIRTFVDRLGDPRIAERIQYPRTDELLQAARKCLS